MIFSLNSPLRYLKGIGPKRAAIFHKIGIKTIEDFFYYFPRRYQDRSQVIPIAQCEIGSYATIVVRVVSQKDRYSYRSRFNVFEMLVEDETGRMSVVWFNQPYLKNHFKIDSQAVLYGKVELYQDRIQMVSPEFEVIENANGETGACGILPVYSLPQGIPHRLFRKIVQQVLDQYLPFVKEVLPFDVRSRHRLLNIAQSLRQIHFPQTHEARIQAYQRLSFEEFFIYQIPLILRKFKRRQKHGIAFSVNEEVLDRLAGSLPFPLTDSQREVIREIKMDMGSSRPMQRLLQGDVGSGKTVVAMIAALIAAGNGYQAAFLVPTEILANQHHEKLKTQFLTFHIQREEGRRKREVRIGLLTSSLDDEEKNKVRKQIHDGEIDIVIGTHALLQEGIEFKRLGLIVIDEQHRFGVLQRALLPQKGVNPDVLIMTATPIPRTLSIALFGDLDISVIRELPAGRKKIQTFLFDVCDKNSAYDFLRARIKEGGQAFVVCPLIEENPKLELASAKKIYKDFSRNIFKEFKVGLIHGKMKRQEQDSVMERFRSGAIDILVSTTILEVGIDVPKASVMLIEQAERFGLSQLHQMRGRIGRGGQDAFCLLVSDAKTEDSKQRMKIMVESSDGFRIAEEDLKLRGPGEFFGERQHGLTELKIANPLTQMHLLKWAREEAIRLLKDDFKLEKRQNQEIKIQLHKRFPEFEKFVEVG